MPHHCHVKSLIYINMQCPVSLQMTSNRLKTRQPDEQKTACEAAVNTFMVGVNTGGQDFYVMLVVERRGFFCSFY